MVFQEPRPLAVAQRRTVRAARSTAGEPIAELDTLFAALGLARHRSHFPGELSLGQARRVALARAFAVGPDLLVLDEPFVSLDAALACRLRDELAALVASRRITTLLVTHNIDEAIGLADRVVPALAEPCPRDRRTADRPAARRAQRDEERAIIRGEIAMALGQVGG